jgi:hypothetical protein
MGDSEVKMIMECCEYGSRILSDPEIYDQAEEVCQ